MRGPFEVLRPPEEILTRADGPQPGSDPRMWQEGILQATLTVMVVVGLAAYIPSIWAGIREGLWTVVVLDTLFYAAAILLALRRSLGYALRANGLIVLCFILGVFLTYQVGPFSGAPFWLFVVPPLTALFFGLRPALRAVGFTAAALIGLGWLIAFGTAPWAAGVQEGLAQWIILSVNFLALEVILSIAVAVLFRGLSQEAEQIAESERRFRALVDASPDGIFLESARGEILDCNEAALRMFGYSREEMLGLSIADLVPEEFAASLPEEIPEEDTTGDELVERENVRKDGTVFPTEITTKYYDVGGRRRLLAYLRDITERKQKERRQQELVEELRTALSRVKQLSGLLPICSSCKKIRDDSGYWKQVEDYISEHSGALFSHGICPECYAKMYPEYPAPSSSEED